MSSRYWYSRCGYQAGFCTNPDLCTKHFEGTLTKVNFKFCEYHTYSHPATQEDYFSFVANRKAKKE